eukprot:TRINITY_DN6945_c0_g1_i12.p1 TRINITY_DN6945_c0_g1~~TRINITY_DN6945_c0_g1_i12.p1  ORF type:complete len:117 (-),score=15.71 TRINITY_DN6945_c0_g1_i12:80-430(-)
MSDIKVDDNDSEEEVTVTATGVKMVSVKQLTQLMINGQNDLVMKYLKALPKDECNATRAKLIKNLEEIQKKKRNTTVSRRGNNSSSTTNSTTTSTVASSSTSSTTAHKAKTVYPTE